MTKGILTMSQKELDRLEVIQRVVSKRLRQRQAAGQLMLSIRQVKRLVRRYREQGASGLVSRHRGKRPGNAIPEALRKEILRLIRTRYGDFGPTLAAEKLHERHGHRLSAETLPGGAGADRRLSPRLVRGSWPPLHPDRLHRRCYRGTDGATLCPGRDHLSLHADPAGVSESAWASRCPVFRQAQHLPDQSPRARRGVDPVLPRTQNPRYRAHPRQYPAGQGASGTSQSDPTGSLGQGNASAGNLRHRYRQYLPASLYRALQPALRGRAPKSQQRSPLGAAQ